MATRRARIKAIVNVPARRSKGNEDSSNAAPSKSPAGPINDNKSSNSSPVEKAETNTVGLLNQSDVIHEPSGDFESIPGQIVSRFQSNSSVERTNVSLHASPLPSPKEHDVDPAVVACVDEENKTSASCDTNEDSNPKEVEKICIRESSPNRSISETAVEKIDVKKNADPASLSSPLKQRSRLFIRPSPKLVDACGRGRYPSGNRHKTSSESEDEPKSRLSTSTIEDSENSIADVQSRASQPEKPPRSQEATSSTPGDQTADAKKNGTRTGRQRARNKENRASETRKRLWLQMKNGKGPAGPLDRSRLTMYDYIYYNPISNPMRSSSESSDGRKRRKSSVVSESDVSAALAEEQVDDPGEGNILEVNKDSCKDKEKSCEKTNDDLDESVGMPAPRVKVGPDGELIVDEQSLVIETTGLKEGLEDLEKGPALVESSSFTNYATYSKRSKGLEWSENDTLRFYRALHVVGTDFSLMQSVLFPKRSRRDLKNKFKREERRNSALIEKALRYPEVFSTVEELQTEFARSESLEKSQEELKKKKPKCPGETPAKRKVKKEGKPVQKKKKRKWLVNGNESEGESEHDSDSVLDSSCLEKHSGPSLEFPEERTAVSPSNVIMSTADDDITMCSQEVLVSNNVEDNEYTQTSDNRQQNNGTGCIESNGEDSDSGGDSQFFSRVLQPTRAGRVPKRRELIDLTHHALKKSEAGEKAKSIHLENSVNSINGETQSANHGVEVIISSKEATEGTVQESSIEPLAVELSQCPDVSSGDIVNGVEPGSLVVIATCAPEDPTRQVYQLFMVSPGQSDIEGQILASQSMSSVKLTEIQESVQSSEV